MSVFKDQLHFMAACGQPTGRYSEESVRLYYNLIAEEFEELGDALDSLRVVPESNRGTSPANLAPVVDGAIDLIYVTIGLIHALGLDPQPLWDEVQRSNLSKLGADGKALRREDGKIMKPESWSPPKLFDLIAEQLMARRIAGEAK